MGTRNVLASNVLVTTTTTSTGTYALATSAVTGYFHPSDVSPSLNGLRVSYVAVDSLTAPTIREEGEGVLASGVPWQLTRATIRRSLTGGVAGSSAINWAAGTKYIWLTPLPANSPYLDTDGWLSIGATASWAGNTALASYVATATGWAISGWQGAGALGGGAALLRSDRTDVTLLTSYFGAGTIVGSITHNTANSSYNTASDARLKDVVGGVANAGAIVDQLSPVRYEWKHAPELGVFTGFLAQDVMALVPEAATASRGGLSDADFIPMQVDLSKLVPFLWAEVQSLRARCAAAGI